MCVNIVRSFVFCIVTQISFVKMMPDLSYLGQAIFKEPSRETGKSLEAWNENLGVNPEEMGEYAEGDILFPKTSRNGLVAQTARWKNGVIPYEISGIFPLADLQIINKAMDVYHKYTCISFRQRRSGDTDYLSIVNNPTGCWSSVGRLGGRQELNLQSPYCTTKIGTAIHELMHAVGFLHEQNRFERDDFVSIAWQNIKKGHDLNFQKAGKDTTSGLGVDYDFRSVMHYSNTAFSTNGKPTIIPIDSSKVSKMGQRDGFSKGDLTKINKMYGCQEKTDQILGSLGTSNNNNNNNNSNNNKQPNPLVSAAEGLLSLLFH